LGLDTIKLERWRSHGKVHKIRKPIQKWAKDDKIDRIRKEAHFFLLEYNSKTNTSPVSGLAKVLQNRGFFNNSILNNNVYRVCKAGFNIKKIKNYILYFK